MRRFFWGARRGLRCSLAGCWAAIAPSASSAAPAWRRFFGCPSGCSSTCELLVCFPRLDTSGLGSCLSSDAGPRRGAGVAPLRCLGRTAVCMLANRPCTCCSSRCRWARGRPVWCGNTCTRHSPTTTSPQLVRSELSISPRTVGLCGLLTLVAPRRCGLCVEAHPLG
jgi:hypothetical protein